MNVQASDIALVFGPQDECGKLVQVKWPFDVDEDVGYRWIVMTDDEEHCVVPDAYLMSLDLHPLADPEARELLDTAGQVAWDRWSAGPEVNF